MKIYRIEFMSYTDCTRDTVSNSEDQIEDVKYKSRETGSAFLVSEDQIEDAKKFGHGIAKLEFLGELIDFGKEQSE